MEHSSNTPLNLLLYKVMHLYFSRTYPMLEKFGIHPGQVPLLKALVHSDGQSQRELGTRLCIKPSTVAVMIQRLQKNDFIERRKDEKDQRVVRIYLTGKGRDSIEQIDSIVMHLEEIVFANFTNEEKILMKRMFVQMQNNLTTAPAPGAGKDGDYA